MKQATFLTTAEFCRGPDLLRPGTLTGKNVSAGAIAFIYCSHPYAGDEADVRVSLHDAHLIFWPAPMGHEKVADREPVLKALFGPDYLEATATAAYDREIYQTDEDGKLKNTAEGELVVVGKKLAYDAIELRRLAIKENLFGRFGEVRGVACLMLWNPCERWEAMVDKLLVLLQVPDDGLVTMGNSEQWWVRDWRGAVGKQVRPPEHEG